MREGVAAHEVVLGEVQRRLKEQMTAQIHTTLAGMLGGVNGKGGSSLRVGAQSYEPQGNVRRGRVSKGGKWNMGSR